MANSFSGKHNSKIVSSVFAIWNTMFIVNNYFFAFKLCESKNYYLVDIVQPSYSLHLPPVTTGSERYCSSLVRFGSSYAKHLNFHLKKRKNIEYESRETVLCRIWNMFGYFKAVLNRKGRDPEIWGKERIFRAFFSDWFSQILYISIQ